MSLCNAETIEKYCFFLMFASINNYRNVLNYSNIYIYGYGYVYVYVLLYQITLFQYLIDQELLTTTKQL